MATPTEVTGPVNIGNPTEFKIIELAEMVKGNLDAGGPEKRLSSSPSRGMRRLAAIL
jgi:hypothetical protein